MIIIYSRYKADNLLSPFGPLFVVRIGASHRIRYFTRFIHPRAGGGRLPGRYFVPRQRHLQHKPHVLIVEIARVALDQGTEQSLLRDEMGGLAGMVAERGIDARQPHVTIDKLEVDRSVAAQARGALHM